MTAAKTNHNTAARFLLAAAPPLPSSDCYFGLYGRVIALHLTADREQGSVKQTAPECGPSVREEKTEAGV